MEIFGILGSIPVAIVASFIYRLVLLHLVAKRPELRRLFLIGGIAILAALVAEILLLVTLGAVRSRAALGPIFTFSHVIIFLLGTPALANVLVLSDKRSFRPAVVVVPLCTVLAFCLVLMQYDVTEKLYGINGDDGPFSLVKPVHNPKGLTSSIDPPSSSLLPFDPFHGH